MKEFLKKLSGFVIFVVFLGEALCRVATDPVLMALLDTYDKRGPKTPIADFFKDVDVQRPNILLVGSSRVQGIDANRLEELSDLVTINAGRGHSTFWTHYQALRTRMDRDSLYLEDAIVLVESAYSPQWCESFENLAWRVYEPQREFAELDKAFPQILLPHLSAKSSIEFIKNSTNSWGVKFEMILYHSAFYRGVLFCHEQFQKILSTSSFTRNGHVSNEVASGGGIRSGNFETAKAKALAHAELSKRELEQGLELNPDVLDRSGLAAFSKLVAEGRGRLILFQVPLHSIQKDISASIKAKKNDEVYREWLKQRNIPLLEVDDFEYSDSDFPDFWHLGQHRISEFTSKLYLELMSTTTLNM